MLTSPNPEVFQDPDMAGVAASEGRFAALHPDDFEERAAIMEYDCGLLRWEAERLAAIIVAHSHDKQ